MRIPPFNKGGRGGIFPGFTTLFSRIRGFSQGEGMERDVPSPCDGGGRWGRGP